MTISVIGHGYVGLVTAVVLAELGNTVWCVGRSAEKIEKLQNGWIPFFEPGLEEVVKRNVAAGRVKVTLFFIEDVVPSKVVFICVGTPSLPSGDADLTSVFAAAKSIAENLKGEEKVVVVKSTVPVGTTEQVKEVIAQAKSSDAVGFEVAFVPEFLREGTVLPDTLHPDRIVIGTESEMARKTLVELHQPLKSEMVLTNIPSAEMIKYASNSLLATKISFANAIAFLCEKVGADVIQVLDGVGMDKRLGRIFLNPGVGYGGSCFPKDVKALNMMFKKSGIPVNLFEEVEKINRLAASNFVEKIKETVEDLNGKTVAVLGLAFKPDTDDMREAPSLKVINGLLEAGALVKAYDPVARETAKAVLGEKIEYGKDIEETVKDADCLLVLTEWNEFKQLDLAKIKNLMKQAVIIDGRNIYDPQAMKDLGFIYKGVGR